MFPLQDTSPEMLSANSQICWFIINLSNFQIKHRSLQQLILQILKMAMTATQFNRNCQNFINMIEKTDQFDSVKQLLNQWKQKNKPAVGAIQTFMNMAKLFQDDEDLVQEFNKCLAKEASIPKKPSTNSEVKQLAMQNQKSCYLLETVYNWIKTDQTQKVVSIAPPLPLVTSTTLQQLTEQQLTVRLQAHRFSKQVTKILFLYRRCIITLKQFKSLIEPIYLSDPSSFNMVFQYAEQLQTVRRKMTIFAPLTDLVDQKYPVEQVGNSYIIIPDGYANYSHTWATNQCEKYLNRICCSVPLGSEGSFVIARKNEYEQQLFKNEEQKYQIDQTICTIKGAISKIQKSKNLNTPLLQKILTKIYPFENVFNIMISQPMIAKNIILPRLHQKIQELYKCKQKFNKACQDVANKNYTKSLDYRCFYFRKNDKKFNSTQRWQKQIQLRKTQILQNIEEFQDQVNDRQALQHTRCHILNTFDNITKQQLFQDKKIDIKIYDKKVDSFYPSYPHNQILFIMQFLNQEVFNDVLEIILYHCQKKPIFQLMVLKLFKKLIHRRLVKDLSVLNYVEMKSSANGNSNSQTQNLNQNNQNSNTNNILFNSANLTNHLGNSQPLNEPRKDRRSYKDITEQFHDLIEQEIQPLPLQELQNPFEGPNQHTFICTKTVYNFLRYMLTIYQRFLKAKQLSDEKKPILGVNKKDSNDNDNDNDNSEEPTLYSQFLAIMIYKVKDPKLNFQQYLRKITSQQAFIYFTLDKFIVSITKLINNINTDTLTYKILKDETKDYENELKKWSQFNFPSITNQLTRIYRQNEPLFRFTYSSTYFMFVSTWQNMNPLKEKTKKENQNFENGIDQNVYKYMTEACKKKQVKQIKIGKKMNQQQGKSKTVINQPQICIREQAQYSEFTQGIIRMKGEFNLLHLKRKTVSGTRDNICKELDRLKKFIKKV